MQPPKLTRVRWQVMQIIKSNRRFQEREFLATEIGNEMIKLKKRMKAYNPGATMFRGANAITDVAPTILSLLEG